jgi:hypothetical protein
VESWARVLTGVLAAWLFVKTPLIFIVANRTRRHLSDAPEEIQTTLRYRIVGGYTAVVIDVLVLVITVSVALTGSVEFIQRFAWLLIAGLAVGFMGSVVGLRGAFDSLYNPAVERFHEQVLPTRFRRRGTEDSSRSHPSS